MNRVLESNLKLCQSKQNLFRSYQSGGCEGSMGLMCNWNLSSVKFRVQQKNITVKCKGLTIESDSPWFTYALKCCINKRYFPNLWQWVTLLPRQFLEWSPSHIFLPRSGVSHYPQFVKAVGNSGVFTVSTICRALAWISAVSLQKYTIDNPFIGKSTAAEFLVQFAITD